MGKDAGTDKLIAFNSSGEMLRNRNHPGLALGIIGMACLFSESALLSRFVRYARVCRSPRSPAVVGRVVFNKRRVDHMAFQSSPSGSLTAVIQKSARICMVQLNSSSVSGLAI